MKLPAHAKATNEDLLQAIESGLSTKELQQKFGISNTGLRKRLLKLGVTVKVRHQIPHKFDEQITSLVKLGKTDADIIQELGCSLSTVKRARYDLGIKLTAADVYARPEYRAKRTEIASSEEYRERQRQVNLTAWSDPALKERHSQAIKEKWLDSNYRQMQEDWSEKDREEYRDIGRANMATHIARKLEDTGSFAERYSELLSEWDYSKNQVDPATLTPGSKVKVWWKCEKGHEWETQLQSRTGTNPSGCPNCSHIVSGDEDILYRFLSQFGINIERNVRGMLSNPNLELDLYLPDHKLAIEVCGQYWHHDRRIDSYAHYNKYRMCHEAGIRLLTIFDSELYNRTEAIQGYLLSILNLTAMHIGARKCEIVQINRPDEESFLEQYHIQGYAPSKFSYGLKYNGEVICLMSFRSVSDTQSELSRFCVKTGYSIPGAASRLLKHFKNNHQYESIISFSDNRYSEGRLYNRIGFTKDSENPPSYWYFEGGKRELIHKFRFRKKSIDAKFGILSGETEFQAMDRLGYHRIWDCGKVKWIMPA